MTETGWETEMASEETPDDAAADDGMADWACEKTNEQVAMIVSNKRMVRGVGLNRRDG